MRSTVAAALEPHVRVQVCLSRRHLLTELPRMGVAAVLTELRDVHGRSAAPFIATLISRLPGTPVIGMARLRAGEQREVAAATRAGMCEVVFVDYESPWCVVRPLVARAPVETAMSAAVGALGSQVPDSLRPIVEYSLRYASASLTPDRLARACGLPRRTLTRRLAAAGLPAPGALVSWTRLCLAASLLEHTTMPVEHVAELAGYPSAVTLRQSFRRYAGVTPSAIRADGGLGALVERFRARPRRALLAEPAAS
jgi:AraC-like DNA-binding protein